MATAVLLGTGSHVDRAVLASVASRAFTVVVVGGEGAHPCIGTGVQAAEVPVTQPTCMQGPLVQQRC